MDRIRIRVVDQICNSCFKIFILFYFKYRYVLENESRANAILRTPYHPYAKEKKKKKQKKKNKKQRKEKKKKKRGTKRKEKKEKKRKKKKETFLNNEIFYLCDIRSLRFKPPTYFYHKKH